jgi:RNA polymerase sigma-70 factor, ECF subfamily
MKPDAAQPDPGLEKYRTYLDLLVRRQVDGRLQAKLDASGIVQQTLWEAHQGLKDLRGSSDAEVAAWLRRILVRNLTDEIRKLTAGKRDLARASGGAFLIQPGRLGCPAAALAQRPGNATRADA